MAIDMSEFTENVEAGLKANKNFTRFLYRFKTDGTTKRGILDYSDKEWDKRTRIAKAKIDIATGRDKQINTGVNFTENSRLNDVAELYFEMSCEVSNWTKERKDAYNLYCKNSIGKKRIKDVRQVDIDSLRKSMELKGHSKQTENGCSPRTIKKILIQILKPIMQYAVDNKVLSDLPNIKAPKQNRQKKTVEDAGVKLATLYRTIISTYEDEPFYRALFLLALYGRRWNEIRTLQWSDINFLTSRYTIRAENNKIGQNQTYELSAPIAEALSCINDEHNGLVFKSPITGIELYPPKKQLAKIKDAANIPELTMHYFRHILVSAMGEAGTATTILSASLGHTNLDTVNNFYLSANHTKASQAANIAIEKLTNVD
ncbi:MAG: tyrosine-type recombinase/integrase [Campylobacterales bacterium]|nr:tyrosine-type recombinase/integrase [Campylobacterales bacterium]